MINRNTLLALMLAVMCMGALVLAGLALSSQALPHYPGIDPLSASRASTIVFAIWAGTAVLFVAAVIAFAIADRRASGTRSILSLPKTRSLLAWLLLALALLTALALMDSKPVPQEQQDDEVEKSFPPTDLDRPVQQPPKRQPQPSPGSKPAAQPAPSASWPWAAYGVVLAALALAGVGVALTLGRKRRPPEVPPEAPCESADDQEDASALPDEEAFHAIEQEPDPRTAVIICYRLFQSLLEQADVPIRTHHTPDECARMAIRSLQLPRRAMFRLVNTYSRARFSEHRILESHKSAALADARQIASIVRDRMAEAARSAESAESAEPAEPKEVPNTVSSGAERT